MNIVRRKDSEEGSVMLVAMVVMLVLTLLGLAATSGSLFEIRMVGNQQAMDEEFSRAEMAVNLSVRTFRDLSGIEELLNDTDFPDSQTTKYDDVCRLDGGEALAQVEIRRIFLDDTGAGVDVSGLSSQANNVPQLSHRYYDGSIDMKRFAITATAMKRGTNTPSRIWVQKGVAVPSEQDRDLF